MSAELTIHQGDALTVLRTLPADSVQCCVTSPPYWGLRDYGTGLWEGGSSECEHTPDPHDQCRCGAKRIDQQIGLEKTPALFVDKLREVFSEVRRCLKPDGTCWINLGDGYSSDCGGYDVAGNTIARSTRAAVPRHRVSGQSKCGLPPKNLLGMPWRVALALQEDGWYLRADIIWHKPNPMPESVTDRPTKSHEYVFLLTKNEHYYYDAESIKEPVSELTNARASKAAIQSILAKRAAGDNTLLSNPRFAGVTPKVYGGNGVGFGHGDSFEKRVRGRVKSASSLSQAMVCPVQTRNKRSVWTIPTFAYPEAHFATYPPALVSLCLQAGSRPGDTILDPFGGSGTTGEVALGLGRSAVLIELSEVYCEFIRQRCSVTTGFAL